MLTGLCLALGTIISWVTSGIAYKLAVLRGCNRDTFLIIERAVILVGISTSLLWLGDAQWSAPALLLGLLGGACLLLSRRTYVGALQYGTASLSWLILAFGQAIPLLLAILAFGEIPSVWQTIGMILIVATLFGVRNGTDLPDLPTEPSMGRLAGAKEQQHTFRNWLILISTASLFEGLFSCSYLLVREFGLAESRNLFIIAYNVTVFLLALAIRQPKSFDLPSSEEAKIGFLGGLAITGASLCGIYAIFLLPAIVFFPLVNSGSLISFTIISSVLWKERFGRRQLVFLGMGLVAIVLICIP